MVSPARLTDKLVFLGFDRHDSNEDQIDWNFGRKCDSREPRVCLRFEKHTRQFNVCVMRNRREKPGRYWSWATPANKCADLLFAMLPPEEVARATAFTLGVAYGQP